MMCCIDSKGLVRCGVFCGCLCITSPIITITINTCFFRLMDERHQHECQDAEAGFQMRIMMLVDGYQDLIRLRDAQTERLEVLITLP
jgi:hypothetical protein